MSVRGGKRNTKAAEREHYSADGKVHARSKFLRKLDARQAARIAAFEQIPASKRGGFKRPGSQNV